MRMDRRSFLKGMLGISMAVAVLPHLPGPEIVAETSILDLTPASTFGRLGRVRIENSWFPLEDAAFTMFRRHAPLLHMPNPTLLPGKEYPPTSFSTAARIEHSLVNSPWQVQLWTPDESVLKFFAETGGEMEFEFDARRASFVGNGFVTEMSTDIRHEWEDGAPPSLFSITLEGDRKLRRFGEIRESDL